MNAGAAVRAAIALLACALAAPAAAQPGVADVAAADLEVALVTYGPGDEYWSRFGHDAIELRDRRSGAAVSFNYGVFDFAETRFLVNFIRGRMHYLMDEMPATLERDWYREQGRSVRRQALDLDIAERARLREFLLWNVQPQHARYRYDYYTDNCATRVRDALDQALGGVLQASLSAHPGRHSWRTHTRRLLAPQPALMLAVDLGLGAAADQPINAWQEAFLPGVLADEVARVHRPDGTHAPLVTSDRLLVPARLRPPPAAAPDLRLPLLLAGAALALLLALCGRARQRAARRVFVALASLWLGAAGLVGAVLLFLWLGSAHHVAWANANLLLFNPLAWGLLPAVWRRHVRPWELALAWAILLLAGAGLALNLSGMNAQQNLPWILLALPVWLALARTLRHAGPPLPRPDHAGSETPDPAVQSAADGEPHKPATGGDRR